MNVTSETSTTLLSPAGVPRSRRRGAAIAGGGASALERASLLAALALSAVMNVYALSQNGYANNFYSAGVRSMLGSLHNFVFVSSDPGGLITIDKPPLSLWLQVASAKIFGFAPLSLLLPEAVAGVLSVLVLYLALAKPLGRPSALMAALTLAIFPAFVAVSRDNNPDALLILLLTVSCWLALRATSSGKLLPLLACAFVVGLGFNTKTLEAYLVVPGIAAAYAICAPGPLMRRVGRLLLAGVVLAVISLAWLVFVDHTPAAHRPWVGSTTDNSEVGLAFEYNGLGRLDGQSGGPNEIPTATGAYVPLSDHAPPPASGGAAAKAGAGAATGGTAAAAGASTATGGTSALATAGARPKAQHANASVKASVAGYPSIAQAPSIPSFAAAARSVPPAPAPTVLPDGRDSKPVPFARAPGPLRLFEGGLGTQAGWSVPLALIGMLALALLLWRSRRDGDTDPPAAGGDHRAAPPPSRGHGPSPSSSPNGAPFAAADARAADVRAADARAAENHEPLSGWRRDPRLSVLLVFGGWFLVEALFLSVAKGIVHPYYTSEMAPGAAAMVGGGLTSLALLIRKHRAWAVLLLLAVGLTAVAQVRIFENNNYMEWFAPLLIAAAALAAVAVIVLRARTIALLSTLAVLSIAPAVYAAATWGAPVDGTFPVAGPRGAAGYGGVDVNPEDLHDIRAVLHYVSAHHPTRRFTVLTVSSVVSSPMILLGSKAASLAGYSGTDPAVSAGRLAAMVKNGEARYVLLGGPYASRGGNGATRAAIKACRIVPPSESGVPRVTKYSFVLMDCAGRANQLAASS